MTGASNDNPAPVEEPLAEALARAERLLADAVVEARARADPEQGD